MIDRTNIEYHYRQEDRPNLVLVVVFIFLQFIFIVCLLSIFALVNEDKAIIDLPSSEQPHVGISNLEELAPGAHPSNLENVQQVLLNMVLLNDTAGTDISMDTEANLKDISVNYFDVYGIGYSTAIVDLPELRQSYRIFYEWSDDDANEYISPNASIMIMCETEEALMIYEDFECQDVIDRKTLNSVVGKYLKYYDRDEFIAFVDPGDEEMKHIRVMSKKHEYTDEESGRYVRETKEFIESLGISPELFEYTVEPAPLGESDEPIYVY
ncbi:hypothetical protein IKG64_02765 [Candidatus Saccharibacteria bacterium]|nr:hypothetical protein [Candidatus Saccharibacteria bacterium]